MKRRNTAKLIVGLAVSLAVAWFFIGLVVLPAAAQAPQPLAVVRYVAPGGQCGGVSLCYAGIQAAVDAAGLSNDEIRVAQGTYNSVSARAGITQMVYLSKTLTIRGGYSLANWTIAYPITQPTILDAQGKGRVLVLSGSISPTIDGLQMMHGNAQGLRGGYRDEDAGGAIYSKDAGGVLSNNTIISSRAAISCPVSCTAGGIYLFHSSPTLRDNLIQGNTAHSGGGLGLYESNAVLFANDVISNTADSGGGLHSEWGTPVLTGNSFISNVASVSNGGGLDLIGTQATLTGNVLRSNYASSGGGLIADSLITMSSNLVMDNEAAFGGGMTLSYHGEGTPLLNSNMIVDNRAWFGAGMDIDTDHATLDGNIISANVAQNDGGGIWFVRGQATFVNTVIIDNQAQGRGGGIAMEGGIVQMLHTTLARNRGEGGAGLQIGGSFVTPASVFMTNTVLAQHTQAISVTAGNAAMLDGVLWFDNDVNVSGAGAATVNHAYTADPLFATDGYHIGRTSAARDYGLDAGVPYDIDSEDRPFGPAPDLGADEYVPLAAGYTVYLPMILAQ